MNDAIAEARVPAFPGLVHVLGILFRNLGMVEADREVQANILRIQRQAVASRESGRTLSAVAVLEFDDVQRALVDLWVVREDRFDRLRVIELDRFRRRIVARNEVEDKDGRKGQKENTHDSAPDWGGRSKGGAGCS